jgi:hypothetical protein
MGEGEEGAAMTEEKWLNSGSALGMWKVIEKRVSPRKQRLFACASCRAIWHLLTDRRARDAVEGAERFADARIDDLVLAQFRTGARNAIIDASLTVKLLLNNGSRDHPEEVTANAAHEAAWATTLLSLKAAARETVFGVTKAVIWEQAVSRFPVMPPQQWDGTRWAGIDEVAEAALKRCGEKKDEQLAELIRDIFGNPFRPVTLDPRWLTASVLDLARAIYDERAFEWMPILADALMDAGCGHEDILLHCRGNGPHVRGCWVVDLLLGKS